MVIFNKCEVCGKGIEHHWTDIYFILTWGSNDSDEYRILDKDGDYLGESIKLCKDCGMKHLKITANTIVKNRHRLESKQSENKKQVIKILKKTL